MTDTMTDLRTRIAAVAQHCREHKPEHECVCSMPPTDWDYELADAVIRELGLTQERRHPVANEAGMRVGTWTMPTESRYVTEWVADE